MRHSEIFTVIQNLLSSKRHPGLWNYNFFLYFCLLMAFKLVGIANLWHRLMPCLPNEGIFKAAPCYFFPSLETSLLQSYQPWILTIAAHHLLAGSVIWFIATNVRNTSFRRLEGLLMPVLSWKRWAVFLRFAFGHEKGAAAETCSRCAQRIDQPLSEALGWHPSEHPPVPLARQLAHNAGHRVFLQKVLCTLGKKGQKIRKKKSCFKCNPKR